MLGEDLTTIPLKTYLHGKLISLNTFDTTSLQREKYLQSHIQHYDKFKAYPDEAPEIAPYYPNGWDPSLTTLFTWRCDPNHGKTAVIP